VVDSSKVCPNCGALLEFRLGRYECPQCDYAVFEEFPEQTASPPPAAPRRGGLPRQSVPAGSSITGVYQARERPAKQPLTPGRAAMIGAMRVDPGALLIEKAVVYGILAVSIVLVLLIFIPMTQRFAFEYGWLGVRSVMATMLQRLGLWLWGMFGADLRAKYTCLLIAIASILGMAIFCIWALYYHLHDEIQYIQQLPFKGGVFMDMDYLYMAEINGWFWAGQLYVILLNVWLLFIMIREIHVLRAAALPENGTGEQAW